MLGAYIADADGVMFQGEHEQLIEQVVTTFDKVVLTNSSFLESDTLLNNLVRRRFL